MSSPVKGVEELYLKIFKVTVLLVMTVALLLVVVLLATAAYQFSQSPKEPTPAQKAPVKDIRIEDLRQFLIEREKRDSNKGDTGPLPAGQPQSLQFQEDATALFRCLGEFGKRVDAEVVDINDAVNAQRLQDLRWKIERAASGSPLRGEPWVKAIVSFSCMALADDGIVALKKEQKVKAIFAPLFDFHIAIWDAIQAERLKYEQMEEARVASERASEALRVATARGLAVTCLVAAGGAFGLFMLLALYLILAKIECDLRDIRDAIEIPRQRPAISEADIE